MKKERGYCGIGLTNPKFDVNVGGVLRAAKNYGADFVSISGTRYKGAGTDTYKSHKHLPLFKVDNLKDTLPYMCTPVAVDLLPDSNTLYDFIHPERAFYIFGAEDETLGHNILDWCKHRVYVPTDGCMNLAAAVNVVLYDRNCKQYNKMSAKL